jgi:glycogen(starch) synthase
MSRAPSTPEPLRVLFVSREYPPETGGGGIGSYVATMARALARRGHDVHVLACSDGGEALDRLDDGVWVHRRRTRRLLPKLRRRMPASARRLEGAVACYREFRRLEQSFDVVEAPDWFAEGLVFGLLRTRPLVAHLHSPLGLVEQHNPGSFHWTRDRRLADRLERASVARADLTTAPSRLLADELVRDGWLRAEPLVIPYPIDVSAWHDLPDVAESPPRILIVGRLEGRKAPEVLVRATAMLRSDVADVEAVFVGQSSFRNGQPYRRWLQDLAEELGAQCRFVHEVQREELRDWYGSVRVVAVPSRFDNYPYAGLEAMASARPVVCTDRTGLAELIGGTAAGAVVPADDPGALAAALRPLLLDADTAAAAGQAARALVASECAPDRIATLREACYREAIRRWAAGRGRHPPP